jgi:hypothetical protein
MYEQWLMLCLSVGTLLAGLAIGYWAGRTHGR